MDHALVKFAGSIDWRFLEEHLGAVYTEKSGPTADTGDGGAGILKHMHMHDLSDDVFNSA
jgi:transposase, IS5 family